MKNSPKKVEKLVKSFLELENVHYGNKIKEIICRRVSTYDGDYPSFTVVYEVKDKKNGIQMRKMLSEDIERYLGMKHGKDYWLGIF